MTLLKLKRLRHKIKLAPLCRETGWNVETMKARIKRESPELTPDESKAIIKYLENITKEFKAG